MCVFPTHAHTHTQFYPLYSVTCLCNISKKSCVHSIKKAQLGHLCHSQKKKYKIGFRMCLKQIPQPNNKHGDSCCFKYMAAQRHGSPQKREGMLAFQQNWDWLQWSYGRIKYSMREGWLDPIPSSLKQYKKGNFIAFSLQNTEGHTIKATDHRTERSQGHLRLS